MVSITSATIHFFFFFANLIVVDIYFEAKQEYACTFTYISNFKKEFNLKI